MKKIFTLMAAAFLAVSANAADRLWKFSDDVWASASTISVTTTFEGLKVWADDGKDSSDNPNGTFTIDSNNKTIGGIACTKRLKSGGSTNATETRTSRCVSIDVTGNCTLKIAALSSSGSATRKMFISTAPTSDATSAAILQTFDVPGSNTSAFEYSYTGAATTLYICFSGGGVNLYYIQGSGDGMPEYEEPDPESQTAANSWDFIGEMSTTDKNNITADSDWSVSDGTYTYKKALAEAAATANGTELEYTKGLKFTLSASQLILTPGTRMNFGGNNRNVIIPGLVKNDYVIVEYKINSADANGRGFVLPSNCELVEGSLTATTTDITTFKIKVKKSGSVTLTSIGGIGVRKIALNAALPTGINDVKVIEPATVKDGAIFNLAGQKVNESYKGVVISNGKKMIQK